MNYIKNEKQIEYNEMPEAKDPVLSFESYVPDDFLYAPEPDIWYRYSISDPVTGGYIIDPTTNLYATDFIAYSVEYEDEFYWTYNVYREEVPGLEPKEGCEDLIDTYAPAETMMLLPQSMGNSWDVKIESYERDLNTGDLDIVASYKTEYPTLVIENFDYVTHDYNVVERPPFDIYVDEGVYVYVNDEMVAHEYLYYSHLFYKIISLYPNEYEYDDSRKERHEAKLHVDYSLIEDDNLDLKIIFEKHPYYYEADGDDSYLIADSTRQTERFVIPTNQDSTYNVNFEGTALNETISVPYSWEDTDNKWEDFKFEKLFENVYEFPTTTKDLLKVTYSDGYTNTLPDNSIDSTATINIDEYPISEVEVKKRYEGDSVIFYIDEPMYYDYENEEVTQGTSSEKFENEKGLVMSWDKITEGEIEFTFSMTTYKTYTFNVSLRMGNSHKLRGDGGMYEIEEV